MINYASREDGKPSVHFDKLMRILTVLGISMDITNRYGEIMTASGNLSRLKSQKSKTMTPTHRTETKAPAKHRLVEVFLAAHTPI